MTSTTADGRPLIARLTPRPAHATGDNGAGAECPDEPGRPGAIQVLADTCDERNSGGLP